MQFQDALSDITVKLKQGRFPNEQSISQGIVLRLLRVLDWDVDDTAVVCPEFSTGQQLKKRSRVDFALCDPPLKPKCFIEVSDFLGKLGGVQSSVGGSPVQKVPDQPAPIPTAPTARTPKTHAQGTVVLQGASFPYTNAKDAMVIVLRELATRDSTFLERCSRHRAFQGRKRRHIAQSLEEIYPGRPDLQKKPP